MDSGTSADTPVDRQSRRATERYMSPPPRRRRRLKVKRWWVLKDGIIYTKRLLLQCAVGGGSLGKDLIDGSH